MKAAFHTLGCKVNQYETEAIKEAFVSRGAEIVGEDEFADVYIVNTCTVTNIADRKSRQFIRRLKSINPDALMVVTGCYAQVAEEEVAEMPEVDIIVGNSRKSKIADLVYDMLESGVHTDRTESGAELPLRDVLAYDELRDFEDMGTVTSAESSMSRAYIKIEEGCDRFCSYCLIPYARGRVRSREPEEIVTEARALIERGCREIVLTGINTALYGSEPGFSFERMEGEEGLSGMEAIIRRIDALDGDFRIRLSSLEPTVVDVNDVRKLLGYEKLCHHLHLSIQSGSDSVLGSMNRRYTRDEYLEIVRMLREFDPLFGITTDIIVGFPGETEEDFGKTVDLVRRAGFGKVHVFRYSPRRGTAGAALADPVPGEVKNHRANVLEDIAGKVSEEFFEKNIGVTHKVLVEKIVASVAEGYTDNYIKVYMDGTGDIIPGNIYEAVLTGLHEDGCAARLLSVRTPLEAMLEAKDGFTEDFLNMETDDLPLQEREGL